MERMLVPGPRVGCGGIPRVRRFHPRPALPPGAPQHLMVYLENVERADWMRMRKR